MSPRTLALLSLARSPPCCHVMSALLSQFDPLLTGSQPQTSFVPRSGCGCCCCCCRVRWRSCLERRAASSGANDRLRARQDSARTTTVRRACCRIVIARRPPPGLVERLSARCAVISLCTAGCRGLLLASRYTYMYWRSTERGAENWVRSAAERWPIIVCK